jgi:hypothetical protein
LPIAASGADLFVAPDHPRPIIGKPRVGERLGVRLVHGHFQRQEAPCGLLVCNTEPPVEGSVATVLDVRVPEKAARASGDRPQAFGCLSSLLERLLGFPDEAGAVDGTRDPVCQILCQPQVVVSIRLRRLAGDPGHRSEHPGGWRARHPEGHNDRGALLRLAECSQLLWPFRNLQQQILRRLRMEPRLAAA